MYNSPKQNNDLYFYKDLFSGLCAIIYLLDLETNTYKWSNKNYMHILGYTEDEVCSNALEFAETFYHPDDKYLMKERLDSFKKNNRVVWSGVNRVKHKEGHWVWLLSKIIVFKRNGNGDPKELLGLVVDATESFETRNQAVELFKEKSRDKNQLFIEKLTERELDIVKMIAQGYTYKEIAEQLYIQPDTVNKHRKNILDKLDLKNIASLVSFATENGLA
jgi:PAS domain S-box-containing protein